MKEIQGTAVLGVTLHPQYNDRGDVGITFNADKWNMRTVRAGDEVVISISHPSLDYIFDAKVTNARRGVITLEWKSSWRRLEEYLPEHRSLCPISPAGRFRADVHIEDISPGKVCSALDQLTCVWGEERHDVSFITPLQAMITRQDLEEEDIVQINNAAADRLRYRRGFKDGAFAADDRTHRLDQQEGASVAEQRGSQDGAFVAEERDRKGTDRHCAFDARAEGQQPFSLKSVSPERTRDIPPTEGYHECWVRPLRHIVPPHKKDFQEVAHATGLNRTQTGAFFLTRKHRLVLARGPPGTGKTQLAASAIHMWAKTVPSDSTVIAAGPSNAAANNLLDRTAMEKGEKLELGRLGDDPSVFAVVRKDFSLSLSLSLESSWGGEYGPVKRHLLNGRVRKLISDGQHHALFSTYMKSAELGSCNTYVLPPRG